MEFSLRFPLAKLEYWASRYDYRQDDEPVMDIAQRVLNRGYYTREELLILAAWKAPRNMTRCARNDSDVVEYATRVALCPENKFERLRIGILTLLPGVSWPIASVLLHFWHKEPYPVLDFRALWSLGLDEPWPYTFDFWWSYVEFCRRLRERAKTTMRTLDRALWQYSKENQK